MRKIVKVLGITLAIVFVISCASFAFTLEKPKQVELEIAGFNGATAWYGQEGVSVGIGWDGYGEIDVRKRFIIGAGEDEVIGLFGITPKSMVIGIGAYFQDTYSIYLRYDGSLRFSVGYVLDL